MAGSSNRLLRTVNVVLGVLLLGSVFGDKLATIVDPDLFHCLAYGRLLFASASFPRGDVFAYTPTIPRVIHHEWILGALHYLVVRRFGATGLLLLRLVVEGALVAGAFGLACRRGARFPLLLLLGPLALAFMGPGLTVLRAQAWTLLFTVILLWLLDFDRRGRRWWIPVYLALHLVWLNAHGGFVLGMVLVAVHGVEEAVSGRPYRHLLPVLLAACALVPVNPYGLDYPRYLWMAMRLDRSLIGEWRPLWDGPAIAVPAWGLSLFLLGYGLKHSGIDRAQGWLMVATTAVASLLHQRHVSIYGVVWLASVAPMLQRSRLGVVVDGVWSRRVAMVTSALAVGGLAAALQLVSHAPWRLRIPGRPYDDPGWQTQVVYPVGPVRWLREIGFRGNALVPFHAGAYVSWKLYPAVRVSIDGRWEAAYPPELLLEHVRFFAAAPGWTDIRARYPTDIVLAERGDAIVARMVAEGAWPVVYEDEGWTVFERPGLGLPIRRGIAPTSDGGFP